jgi:hypothetical protein
MLCAARLSAMVRSGERALRCCSRAGCSIRRLSSTTAANTRAEFTREKGCLDRRADGAQRISRSNLEFSCFRGGICFRLVSAPEAAVEQPPGLDPVARWSGAT